MTYNTNILSGNNIQKKIFMRFCGNLVQRNLDDVPRMILAMGGDSSLNLGGKFIEIAFDDKLHASAGVPVGATGVVSGLYTPKQHGVLGAVTPDWTIGYSSKRIEKGLLFDEGGEEGNYMDEISEAEAHCLRQIAHQRSACFAWEGNGKVNEIALNSAQINVASQGTITVAVRTHLQPEWLLEVRDSGGSLVSNVTLRVDDVEPGPQQGAVTVTNVGSANYTPTLGHQLYVSGSSGNLFMPGLLSACNNTAYPLAGGNNVQINNSKFKAQVEEPTLGSSLSHRDLIYFDQQGHDRMPDDVRRGFDTRNKVRTSFGELETCHGIYLMSISMLNALRDNFFQTGNTTGIGVNRFERSGQFPTEIDQGWGKIHLVDGIKVHATNWIPDGVVLRVYAPGFKIKFNDPVRVSPRDYRNMAHIGGSMSVETIMAQLGTAFVKNRMPQGRLNGRTGFTAIEAGWEEEGY